MFSKKTFLALTGSLLATSAVLGVVWQQGASSQAYGKVIADQPVTVVADANGETILMTKPTQKQMNHFAAMLDTQPELAGDKVKTDAILGIDALSLKDGEKQNKSLKHKVIKVKGSEHTQAFSFDLYSVETDSGTTYVQDKATAYPLLIPNPKQKDLFVFEHNYVLYLFNAKTQDVTPIGDLSQYTELRGHLNELEQKHNADATPGEDHSHVEIRWASVPVWSADGKSIAYITNRDQVENSPAHISLFVYDLKSGEETKIYESSGHSMFKLVGWSKDGQVLVQTYENMATPDEGTALAAIDPATKEAATLVEDFEYAGQSDDHKTILYTQGSHEAIKVYALDLTSKEKSLVFQGDENNTLRSYTFDFSADNQRIVTDLTDKELALKVLTYDLAQKQSKVLDLPKNHVLSDNVKWADDKLVVPVENLKDLTSQTLLMSVDEE
ncbi:TolB family protein [Brevibacillus dissolubilis]|uniref:TolB family protein n=1 Tax=Brevibacillus dissolubilis TaxID=1844116 RepID=UPI0011170246|nr:PD40 domain-containing protein [Brevibacillus dissolubilis]